MANINRKWKRVVAVGCNHGTLANKAIQGQVLAFVERYKPEIRFDLGDVIDTTAFRHGAKGTPDEGADIAEDYKAGVAWILQYKPTHLTWGNHDARLDEIAQSPNAMASFAAIQVKSYMQGICDKLKTKTVPYDYEHGWFLEGGTYWGHGYWYNMAAVRDHAEYLGAPLVIAHLHRAYQESGRTRKNTKSFCVGTLADIDAMHYARRRRATSQWSHGVVFGEMCETESKLWLTSCAKGESLSFPPGC